MVIADADEEVKAVLERVSRMCFKGESVLSLCMDGFMKHKIALIDEAKKISHAIHNEENELITLLTNKAAKSDMDKQLIKSLMAVVGHIEMATNGLDGILQNVKSKVAEGVLFSDKGVNEISHLFKETLDMLKTAGDIILTRNEVLRKYVADKYKSFNQIADAYSEEHEDRLIKGVCQPKSSSLYLNIVDSLSKIVWHIRQAVDRLFVTSRC
ncbi:MAG: hypothetical protein CV087_13830 [Candidatus Brocadia sp. WS118]|nr:MAG: hypothetical protein CV087_13830 [Candidatus Brocadia sp. WS118]